MTSLERLGPIFLHDPSNEPTLTRKPAPLRIEVLKTPSAAWLRLPAELWPHESKLGHERAVNALFAEPSRFYSLLAVDAGGAAHAFIEDSIRSDAVNGTKTSPVGYIEGLLVTDGHRWQGIAIQLINALSTWFKDHGCQEIASDTAPTDSVSLAAHLGLGFEETERTVFFKKCIDL